MPWTDQLHAANRAFRDGQWGEALNLYRAVLEQNAENLEAALQAARCCGRAGNLNAAAKTFAAITHKHPLSYAAWLELGNACVELGRHDEAEAAYWRAIGIETERFEALFALGLLLEDAGSADAPQLIRRALADAAAHSATMLEATCRQLAQRRLARRAGALALEAVDMGLQCAIQRGADANLLNGWMVLRGEALFQLGRKEQAWKAFSAASTATDEGVLGRLGEVSYNYGMMAEAEDVFRRNLELHPGSGGALFNLGKVLVGRWKVREAQTVLQKAEEVLLQERDVELARRIGVLRAEMHWRAGNASAAHAAYLGLWQRGNPSKKAEVAPAIAMTSLYNDALGAGEVLAMHRQLFAPLGEGARSVGSFRRAPLAGRRLRVGMVGADMSGFHPVNQFLQPMLRELDRSRLECFFYHCGGFDEQSQLARQRVEHWREAGKWSDEQLARRIDADEIDVLVDLVGLTGTNKAALFARRAAPVQALYLGYPGTTGLPNMDWLIGDPVVTPEWAEKFYSEKIARLPGTVFCYAPEEHFPLPDFSAEMLARPLTFGSIHNAPKLNSRTLRLYAGVLAALPQARLIIRAPSFVDGDATAYFRNRLAELGADLSRIAFEGPVKLPDMMAAFSEIDIALDAVPYNGGTTTHQALWMGVPVIAIEGEGFAARMGASFLRAAGLHSWVASSDEGFVEIAVRMAADRQALLDLKRDLRARLQAKKAWDPVAHTRAFEDVLCAIAWQENEGA